MTLTRLNVIYFLLFTMNSLSAAIMLAFLNSEWHTMSPTSRVLVFVAIIQNWTGTMLAFMFKTIQRVEKGKPPIGDDTVMITKDDVAVQSTKQETLPAGSPVKAP